MLERETVPAERPQQPPRMAPPAEPGTPRALWPTFMRRTLSEDVLQRQPDHAPAR